MTGNLARLDLNSGGLQAYNGTAQTFNLAANGSLSLVGSILSGSTITGTVLTGTSGLTAGSGNSVFVAGSSGIQLGHATFGSAPFRVSMAGALVATSATITGTVTSSTITATNIDASNTVSGQSLVAGTVTAEKVSVGVTVSDDLTVNGMFLDTVGTTTTPSGWQTWVTSGTVLSSGVSTANARFGVQSLAVNLSVSSAQSWASTAIPVRPGDKYSLAWSMLANTQGGPVSFRAMFGATPTFTSSQLIGTVLTSGSTPATVDAGPYTGNPAYSTGFVALLNTYTLPALDTWYDFRGTITVPVGALYMRVVAYFQSNVTSGWTGYLDGVVTRRQITGTEILSGSIATGHITASGISGTVITANTLSAAAISTSTLGASTMITAGVPGGIRVEIDGRSATPGIRTFNASNVNRFSTDALTGDVTVTGVVNAASGTFSGTITSSGTISGGTVEGATVRSSSTVTTAGGFNLDTAGIAMWSSDPGNTLSPLQASFEGWPTYKSGSAAGWVCSGGYTVTPEQAFFGTQSLRVTLYGGTTYSTRSYSSGSAVPSPLPVMSASTLYQASVYMMLDPVNSNSSGAGYDVSGHYVSIFFYTSAGVFISSGVSPSATTWTIQGSGPWYRGTMSVTSPAGAAYGVLYIRHSTAVTPPTTGSAWVLYYIDGAQIHPGASPAPFSTWPAGTPHTLLPAVGAGYSLLGSGTRLESTSIDGSSNRVIGPGTPYPLSPATNWAHPRPVVLYKDAMGWVQATGSVQRLNTSATGSPHTGTFSPDLVPFSNNSLYASTMWGPGLDLTAFITATSPKIFSMTVSGGQALGVNSVFDLEGITWFAGWSY